MKGNRARQLGTDSGDEFDNQLASIFARWVFQGAVEVYGEYAREDYNVDAIDLYAEPDQNAAYMIGMQRAWRRTPSRLLLLRAELLNARVSHLNAVRIQAPFYVHNPLTQGHTERGQVLGSIGAHGGGAAELSLTEYSPQGEWTIGWTRIMRGNPAAAATLPSSGDADVLHALAAERLFFRQGVDIGVKLTAVLEANRDPGSTAANLNLMVKAKAHW